MYWSLDWKMSDGCCYVNEKCCISVPHKSEVQVHETQGHKTTSPQHREEEHEEHEESRGIFSMLGGEVQKSNIKLKLQTVNLF